MRLSRDTKKLVNLSYLLILVAASNNLMDTCCSKIIHHVYIIEGVFG